MRILSNKEKIMVGGGYCEKCEEKAIALDFLHNMNQSPYYRIMEESQEAFNKIFRAEWDKALHACTVKHGALRNVSKDRLACVLDRLHSMKTSIIQL